MGKTIKLTTENFITRAKAVHGTYCYNKTKYINIDTKVIITCEIHGDFEQTPHNHLKGCGCKQCGLNSKIRIQSDSTDSFIFKAKIVHSNKYNYDTVNYINRRTKVTITCPEHGSFTQIPNDHLTGSGCSKCAISGFDPAKPAILYYLKLTTDDGQILYKIGITNRTINERFNLTDLSKIEILKQKLYPIGQDACTLEQKLLKMYSQYKYVGPKILESGNTELFIEDVLTLYHDNSINQIF